MRILLIGEFSRLHNSLKEGLKKLGHEVIIIGTKDGFKSYPVDINIGNRIINNAFATFINKGIYKLLKIDLAAIERTVLFLFYFRKFKQIDCVQIVHESPIARTPLLDIFILKKVLKKCKKLFVLSAGVDYHSMNYAFKGNFKYSILTPLMENVNNKVILKKYKSFYRFFTSNYKKLISFLYENSNGMVGGDLDYHIPLQGTKNYLGMIRYPINVDKFLELPMSKFDKIKIFHGINEGSYYFKGNSFFENALEIINEKYGELVEISIVRSLPYSKYINTYNNCHILLDQVYAYDQGYNALEAMAKGKVVFTGAEQEFLDYYNLEKNEVCINALPDVDAIVGELEDLILNPSKIEEISKNARKFIEKEHHYVKIAQKYLDVWNSN